MKKIALALAISAVSLGAVANDAPDMGSPTEAYTYLGASYGNDGFNLKGMVGFSEDKGGYEQKSGVLIDIKDIFNENGGDPSFYQPGKEVDNRTYRVRVGTVNTKNGLGGSIDAINFDHPIYGRTTVVQGGPVATIPLGDRVLFWPILYVGGAMVENRSDNPMLPGSPGTDYPGRADGVNIASTLFTSMNYMKVTVTDNIWVLASYQYTTELQGKKWGGDPMKGDFGMDNSVVEISAAYQFSPKTNLRAYYNSQNDDSYWVEYNYAF
ncbi:hypothetical protein [Ferrimonas pelagia]|uniref:MetA-pathway of phenol degradation n=1 Tax=Ferrimonas pelagia TaxID=1177826 RepID=A0ABP9F140_9GAMM